MIKKLKLTSSGPILRFIKPHRWLFLIGLVFLLLSSATALIFPSLMGDLLDAAKSPDTDEQTWWQKRDINSVTILLLIVFGAQAIFSFFRIYLFALVTERFLFDLRKKLYDHVICLPMHFFQRERVGALNSRMAADIALLQETFTTTLAEFIRQFLTIAVGVILISIYSWQLTLLMLGTVPVIAMIAVFFGRFIKKFSNKAQEEVANATVVTEETFTTIAVVKAFANEALEMMRYQKAIERVQRYGLIGAKWKALFVSFLIFTVFGAIVLVIWQAANLKEEGLLTIGELVKFVLYTVFIGASFAGIPELYAKIQKAVGATEHLMSLLKENKEVVAPSDKAEEIVLDGSIEFREVGFAYPSRPEIQVIKNLSFTIQQGERIALVGPSGAGKSTIINLLLRFYEVTQGNIYLGDRNINDLDLYSIRSQLALVPQEIILFGGTILENIAYGNPESSRDEVESAAKKAYAHDFITSFPKGYDEYVGERGVQLSGGQRQRIAIARLFLKNPSILILDEATSSLDSESEQRIQKALDALMKGRTSIIIAHRLSTVQNADRILVLDQGELREMGSHEELKQVPEGLYNRLRTLQFEEEKASTTP